MSSYSKSLSVVLRGIYKVPHKCISLYHIQLYTMHISYCTPANGAKNVGIALPAGLDYKTEVGRYLVSHRNTPHGLAANHLQKWCFSVKIGLTYPRFSIYTIMTLSVATMIANLSTALWKPKARDEILTPPKQRTWINLGEKVLIK